MITKDNIIRVALDARQIAVALDAAKGQRSPPSHADGAAGSLAGEPMSDRGCGPGGSDPPQTDGHFGRTLGLVWASDAGAGS